MKLADDLIEDQIRNVIINAITAARLEEQIRQSDKKDPLMEFHVHPENYVAAILKIIKEEHGKNYR